jgi:hypothetical protein
MTDTQTKAARNAGRHDRRRCVGHGIEPAHLTTDGADTRSGRAGIEVSVTGCRGGSDLHPSPLCSSNHPYREGLGRCPVLELMRLSVLFLVCWCWWHGSDGDSSDSGGNGPGSSGGPNGSSGSSGGNDGSLANVDQATKTDIGTAYSTLADVLGGATYDDAATKALALPGGARGVAFTKDGKRRVAVWAATQGNSEAASASVELATASGFEVHAWDDATSAADASGGRRGRTARHRIEPRRAHGVLASGRSVMSTNPTDRRRSLRSSHVVLALIVAACGCATPKSNTIVGISTVTSANVGRPPLASWIDGPNKRAIVDFVKRVSSSDSPNLVPAEERIAVFENNGALWPEKPLPQAAFVAARLRAKALESSKLRNQESYGAVMKQGAEGLESMGNEAIFTALAQTNAGMTGEAFEADARSFLFNARHPRFDAPYPSLAYAPMRELLAYLREHGFTTYLNTDEDEGFARSFAPETYEIPRERIIGSNARKELVVDKDRTVLRRLPEIDTFNDGDTKVVSFSRQVGRRPVLAVGNASSAGGLPMLTFAHGNTTPSLQVVVQHDDAARELAYAPDEATMAAARERGFVIVSMKNDWSRIFDKPSAGARSPLPAPAPRPGMR